jgi:ATP-dependent exoDNAse (exonuclease V) alpha subunit
MQPLDHNNEMFLLAAGLVNESNRNIFLTGKAGTGKTTFLKYIKENCIKQIAVTAPTGVAAINAGGATIHSFFQLPLSPFIPDARGFTQNTGTVNKHSLLGKMRMAGEKRRVLQQLELLIIDEISMVRCDTLDAIDLVLKHFRNRHTEPFGGVQVLFIGDMFQLPPVVPDEEWNLLSQFYKSAYFFDSQVMQQFPPVHIEFQKIYRQSDQAFINLLNEVRHNKMSEAGLQLLNSRYDPWFELSRDDGFIFLTTHNYASDRTNAAELSKLKQRSHVFKAVIEGEFYEKSYPADETLELKEGAQVMFIKNDKEKIKRYYNGKIGTVSKIEEDKVFVECKGNEDAIEVQKEKWENIRYSIDKQTQQLEEEVIGSFTQFPFRLAWSITIHKSQGLTFEKAVIDAGRAFAPGQVYVALSRCTSLKGIVLKSELNSSVLHTDGQIIEFSEKNASEVSLKQELQESKKSYRKSVLLSLFDLSTTIQQTAALNTVVKDNKAAFNEGLLTWITEVENKLIALQSVADKFRLQLNSLFAADNQPGQGEKLSERVAAAAVYFINKLDEIIGFVRNSPASTDSKQHAKAYNDALKEVFVLLAEKKHLLGSGTQSFSIDGYYRQKKSFTVSPFNVNCYATAVTEQRTGSPHPALHKKLRELRNRLCELKDLPVYYVANSATIDEMATYLPQTLDDIVKISGFGQAKAKQYGRLFLQVINEYCDEHNVTSSVSSKENKRVRKEKVVNETKDDSKTISYNLHKEGNSIAEIAGIRNLAISTIEQHLTYFIHRGLISVHELVKTEKIILIEPHLQNTEHDSIVPIKQKLGDSVSFGEIRMVLAAKEWEQSKNETHKDRV